MLRRSGERPGRANGPGCRCSPGPRAGGRRALKAAAICCSARGARARPNNAFLSPPTPCVTHIQLEHHCLGTMPCLTPPCAGPRPPLSSPWRCRPQAPAAQRAPQGPRECCRGVRQLPGAGGEGVPWCPQVVLCSWFYPVLWSGGSWRFGCVFFFLEFFVFDKSSM